MRFLFHFPAPRAGGSHFSPVVEGIPGGVGYFRRKGACETAADDVCGVHNEEKSVGIHVFDEMAQFGDLRQIHDSENDFLIFSAEPALSVEESGAVMDISEDSVRYFKRLVGNDEGRFSLGETDDDTAGNGGVDVHGDECADGGFQCEDPCTGHDDDEVQAEDNVAYFQIVKFLDDRADDVKASGI